MTKPSLFSKRRTIQRRNTSKREPKLDKVFDCLCCNHSKCVICKLDFERKVGTLICETCPVRYSCIINHLSKEVDVYSEWVDSFENPQQIAQPKPRPQAIFTAAAAPVPLPASAATQTQTQTEEKEPLVRPSRIKTSGLFSATTRAQNQVQAQDRPSRSQSRSPLSTSEALAQVLAPVHDRPSREQTLSPLPSRELSYSTHPSPRPQAQTQAPLSVQTPVQFQAQVQSQSCIKERIAVSVSPYHDQNDDNASQIFQQGGIAAATAATAATSISSATVSPGQPWVQGNNRQQHNSERRGHGSNKQQGYRNDANINNQGFGSNNNYNNNPRNHSYGFQAQDYGYINPGFGGYQGFDGNSLGYGVNQDFDGSNHGFGGNQGFGGIQGYGKNNNQGSCNSYRAYGTNNNRGCHGTSNQFFHNNSQAYGTSNQRSYGSQFSAHTSNNNNLQNNAMILSSSYSSGYSSGYYDNNIGAGNFSDYDAYNPAVNAGGSPYDYTTGDSTGIEYNTTGGYSDH
ncbi:hypothetical protein BGZ97_007073 [Linnemannia gamsii]|uniref:Transcription elongation factor 1 homolog n=1 Tax=Linnemannia gamsii TaxID=64522 RepID=A0A9P6RC37_9FUNG|nr:hypothetical protein BGZ97_007073 [Linnemannia gamsii]